MPTEGLTSNRLPCTAAVSRRGLFLAGLASFGLSLALTGCGHSRGSGEMNEMHLYRLTGVYNMYARSHGQPPPDEKAFEDFISALPEEQRSRLGATDVEAFLTSPRDGNRYVVLYGDQAKKNKNGVVAYEKEPNDEGKRLLSTTLGDVGVVDETEFKRLTSTTKKKT